MKHETPAHTAGAAAAKRAAPDTHGVAAQAADDVVCYCGLYETCPSWNQMNDEERRACSSDKRMTAEYYWKYGVTGA